MAQTPNVETVRALVKQYSNWGRWGADDDRGTLNHLTPERVAAHSIEGEVYYLKGRLEQALQTFDLALSLKTGKKGDVCRILYGLARIHFDHKRLDEARRFANRIFIMYNDEYYAPRAQFLAMKIAVTQGDAGRAGEIARLMKGGYPLYFAKNDVQEYLKEKQIKSD